MHLRKNQKILLGILHFLPLLGFVVYFFFIFSFVFNNMENLGTHPNEQPPLDFFKGFFAAFIVIILTLLITIGIKIFDIIHLTKSNKGDKGNKILLWVLLFVFVGTISEILYYFLEILPEKKEDSISL